MGKTICIWGASTTEGFYDIEAGGWVDRIKHYFKFKDAVSVYNLGISGDDTNGILDRFDIEAKHREPNMVILSTGTNDSCYLIEEKKHKVDINQFERNLNLFIKKAKKYTENIVFISSLPVDEEVCNPWQGDKIYLNDYLKKYNAKILEVCQQHNIKVIELFSRFENAGYKKLLYDGLHPNSEGHKLVFKIIRDSIWKK